MANEKVNLKGLLSKAQNMMDELQNSDVTASGLIDYIKLIEIRTKKIDSDLQEIKKKLGIV